MKNRKKATLVCSAALVGVIGIGATLAYFTDSDEATNTVTMGHVDIDLTESNGESITDDGLTFDNVMPGDTIPKIPTITVRADSQDAYVRMKMDIKPNEGSGITQKDIAELENLLRQEIVEGTDWAYDGEYYYYDQAMAAGSQVNFFDEVRIPTTWTNNTADKSFTISLQAEAIQAANVTPEMGSDGEHIMGWPEAAIEKYAE